MIKGPKLTKFSNQSSRVSLHSNGGTLFINQNNSYSRSSARNPSIIDYQTALDNTKAQHAKGGQHRQHHESSYISSNSKN